MLSEKEFYLYVEKNILKYLPEMEDQKVMVQRVKKNNQVSMMGLSIGIICFQYYILNRFIVII